MQLTSDVPQNTQDEFNKLLGEDGFEDLQFFSHFYIHRGEIELTVDEKNEVQTLFQNHFIQIFSNDSLESFISNLEKISSKSDSDLEKAKLSRHMVLFLHDYAVYINEIRKPNPDSNKCKELANKLHFGMDFFVLNGFFPLNSSEGKQLYDRIQQDASISESEILRLGNKEYADAIDPQLGIANKHLIALRLFSYYETETEKVPSAKEMELMQDFLKSVRGDMKLNAALRKMATMGDEELKGRGLFRGSVDCIAYYIYKTRRFSVFNSALDRLFRNYQNDQQGIPTTEQDKVSLAEYGSVCDIASLNSTMQFWEQKGFLRGDNDLMELRNNAERAYLVAESLENKFGNESRDNANPGRIVLSSERKANTFSGTCSSFFYKIARIFITKHMHASKLFASSQEGAQISHINPNAMAEDFEMSEYLYSDVYRIKIEALIPKEQQEKLRAALGEDWLSVVQAMYGEIERDIHDETVSRFSRLTTISNEERNKRLMPTWLPFGLGNKKFAKNDFEQIHDQVFGQFYQQGTHKMLCSEFIAHTTIAALVELNGILQDVVDETQRAEMVQMPFGEHEDLRAMHPDRLVSVLKQAGCIEEEAKVSTVAAFFREEGQAPKQERKSEVEQQSQQQQSEINKELGLVLANNEGYADAVNKKLGISNKHVLALKLMSYYTSNLEVKPTEQEREIIQDFLREAKGNTKLNTALKKIVKMGDKSLASIGLSKAELDRVILYTSRTKDLDVFRSEEEGYGIENPFENFSSHGYVGVREIAKLDTIVHLWEGKGFLSGDADLSQLPKDVKNAQLVVRKIDSEVQLGRESSQVISEDVDNPFAAEKDRSSEVELDQKIPNPQYDGRTAPPPSRKPPLNPKQLAEQQAELQQRQVQSSSILPKQVESVADNKVKTGGGFSGFFRSAAPKFQGQVTREQLEKLSDKDLVVYGKELLKKIDSLPNLPIYGKKGENMQNFRAWLYANRNSAEELKNNYSKILEGAKMVEFTAQQVQTETKATPAFRLSY